MPLPKIFEDEEEFLEDFERDSKKPEVFFSIEQVNYIYELAGKELPFDYISPDISMALPYHKQTTRELLDKASKNISEKAKKLLEFNVLYLDPYRENNNNISYIDDYR